jgi:membrane protein DedA with SNARE-associated domain
MGIRSAVPLVAGVGDYPRNRALMLGAVSIIIWNGLLATGALVLGENWDAVSRILSTYSKVFWTVGGIVLLIWAFRFYLQKRRRANHGE